MTTSETKLRDLILASEGKTLEDELVFGCEVNCGGFTNWKMVNEKEGVKQNIVGERHYIGLPLYGDYEILGLPITLERIRNALLKRFEELEGQVEQIPIGEMINDLAWRRIELDTDETYDKLCELLTQTP